MLKFIFILIASFLVILTSFSDAKNEIVELANDGTWCWFSDPRAIYVEENNSLVTGFVTEDGSVAALQYSFNDGRINQTILNEKLEVDDHNNPAFVQRADGRFLAFYTKHHNTSLYMNVSTEPNLADAWDKAIEINPNRKVDLEKYGDDKYTYANPFMLKNENNRIYLFGRWIGFKPNMSWSDDGGSTWSEGRVVVCSEPFSWGKRPYVKYFSNGSNKIHMVFTDGHPRDEAFNSVYYACYYKGAFHKANGEEICTTSELPFAPEQATMVYDAKTTGNRAWVFDLFADDRGNPAIAYARYPTETEHIYHYTIYDGEKWIDSEIVNSGKWFPQTPLGEHEKEPHYSGGLSISANQPNTVYVSVQNEGKFEIEKRTLVSGKWEAEAITPYETKDQVRPYVIKNSKKNDLLLWNSIERYIHYTNYKTSVKMMVK
ncbi:MAG: BNR-4 repeat-containing protein [Prolixibacteraceae bacterium]|jgi:hypothetical protein|nr:BNR-4 repeat-containing protein [Prolixibacteraceae bacterium]